MSLNLRLALRFMRSGRSGVLTRFISFASTCGIALGVFAAVVALSAMNGFEYELKNRVLSVIPSAVIKSEASSFEDADSIIKVLLNDPNVKAVAKAAELDAVLIAGRTFVPVKLNGIDPEEEASVVSVSRFSSVPFTALEQGEYCTRVEVNSAVPSLNLPKDVKDALESARNADSACALPKIHVPHIILGASLAAKLKVEAGNFIEIVTLKKTVSQTASLNNALKSTDRIKLMVAGTVSVGGQVDTSVALMNRDELLKIAGLAAPNVLHIRTAAYQSTRERLIYTLKGKLTENVTLSTWDTAFGKLYHDIQMVRQIVFISMFLVMAVACFNIISNLMMKTGEKRREIAVLLSLGMTGREILYVFSLMGVMSGGYGILIGLMIGIPFSIFITPLTASFKDLFGFELLNADVYFINFIPSLLHISDVLIITGAALFMSLLSAVYPAFRASAVKPARELAVS